MVNMSQTEEKILKSLVEKPKTYYVLFKHEEVAKSNTTVLETLQKMDNKKWITEETTKDYERNQKPYKLTLFGILVGYNQGVLTTKHIPRIVETFKEDIPLVFGEWDYFKKEEVEKIATKHLMNTLKGCGTVRKQVLDGWKKYAQTKDQQKTRLENAYNNSEWLTQEDVAQKINNVFLFKGLHFKPEMNFFVTHNIFIDYLTDDEEKILIDVIERNKNLGACRAKLRENCLYTLKRALDEIKAALKERTDWKK